MASAGPDNDMSAADAARALSARRRRVTGACAVCGQPFTGTTKRLYCSERCKQAAKYAKRKRLAAS